MFGAPCRSTAASVSVLNEVKQSGDFQSLQQHRFYWKPAAVALTAPLTDWVSEDSLLELQSSLVSLWDYLMQNNKNNSREHKECLKREINRKQNGEKHKWIIKQTKSGNKEREEIFQNRSLGVLTKQGTDRDQGTKRNVRAWVCLTKKNKRREEKC